MKLPYFSVRVGSVFVGFYPGAPRSERLVLRWRESSEETLLREIFGARYEELPWLDADLWGR